MMVNVCDSVEKPLGKGENAGNQRGFMVTVFGKIV